ncbi:choline ABC transporter, permease protein, partial [Vibrio parahaemolyticus V-223/04]
WFFLV